MQQQINTFEEMFSYLDEDGICFCEDMHASYWKGWGGGYRKKGSFIEYCKKLIDYINAWHSQTTRLSVTEFTRSARSLHFYDSVFVIEKGVVNEPFHLKTGEEKITQYNPQISKRKRFKGKIKNFFS